MRTRTYVICDRFPMLSIDECDDSTRRLGCPTMVFAVGRVSVERSSGCITLTSPG